MNNFLELLTGYPVDYGDFYYNPEYRRPTEEHLQNSEEMFKIYQHLIHALKKLDSIFYYLCSIIVNYLVADVPFTWITK